jgi:cardiolipin-specific phospholipase
MLKTYTSTSVLVPKRLKLVSLQHSNKMTNDATLSETRPQHPQQQPMLASQRAKQQAQAQAQQRPATYFPLGYKEAAHQWVCLAFVIDVLYL